jgi:hypothetical protein
MVKVPGGRSLEAGVDEKPEIYLRIFTVGTFRCSKMEVPSIASSSRFY